MKFSLQDIISKIYEKAFIINLFRENLKQKRFNDGGLALITDNNPIWFKDSGRRKLLNEAIENTIKQYQNQKHEKLNISIDEQLIRSFYNDFKELLESLEKFQNEFQNILAKDFSSVSLD